MDHPPLSYPPSPPSHPLCLYAVEILLLSKLFQNCHVFCLVYNLLFKIQRQYLYMFVILYHSIM
jgi:hypothetical protein